MPITDNEINELRNLRKKVEYLKDKLEEEKGGYDDNSASDEEEDEEVADV